MTSPFAHAADRALAPILAARAADWRIGPIVYQVLVDRFAPSTDLEAKRHHYAAPRTLHSWDEQPAMGTHDEAAGLWSHELAFWGGDIASLTGRLDYLQGLGVDVVYLNPVHRAYTNHKYDAQDYFEVSPEFGTRADVAELAQALHGRGMQLVLDGVLNHMGRTAPMFEEERANPDSPWRDFFYIGPQWRHGYRCWWDVANLPDVNWENPAVKAWLFGSPQALIDGWLAQGVDGFRLDVAYDIGFTHLADLTAAAHTAKPGSLVLGECYNYPADWVAGDELSRPLDAILNISLSEIIRDLAEGSISGRHAGDLIERMVADTDYEGLLRSWIVLDNHDKARLASWLPDPKAQMIAQLLQFTLPGAVNLYYGVEAGMEGPKDPENRGPMAWDRAVPGEPAFDRVRALIQARKATRALRIGEFRRLDADQLLAFTRYTDVLEELAVVIVNPTDSPVRDVMVLRDSKVVNFERLRCALTGFEAVISAGLIRVEVPARTGLILRPVMNRPGREYAPYKRVS
jgi:glycosidase